MTRQLTERTGRVQSELAATFAQFQATSVGSEQARAQLISVRRLLNAAKYREGLLRDLRPALEDAFRASATDTRPPAEVGFFKTGLALIDAGRIERDGRTVRVNAEVEVSLLDAVLGCLAAGPSGLKR